MGDYPPTNYPPVKGFDQEPGAQDGAQHGSVAWRDSTALEDLFETRMAVGDLPKIRKPRLHGLLGD